MRKSIYFPIPVCPKETESKVSRTICTVLQDQRLFLGYYISRHSFNVPRSAFKIISAIENGLLIYSYVHSSKTDGLLFLIKIQGLS